MSRARSGGSFAGELDQLAERRRVCDGHVGEDLAIQLDLGRLQRGDEPRVGGPVLTARGVDALDPQRPEIALAELTTDVSVLPGLEKDADRFAVTVSAAADEALRLLEDAIMASPRDGAS